MNLTPIIIFTYRRKIDKLIESLLKNDLSIESELYIFSDGYKGDIDKKDVSEVRNSLKNINGFKNITIKEYDKNNGLAKSVIDGVTSIIDKYEKVIVLEDDLIVSTNFLEYMNKALEFYATDSNIWSISGYGPKLLCIENYANDLYLSPRGSSWGWATWQNRWDTVDWKIKDFAKLTDNRLMREQFELAGNDMYKMLELQMLGKIDSWAIRWCFSQFLQNKYTVYPAKSKVLNDGFNDSKGIHNNGGSRKWDTIISEDNVKFKFLEIDCRIMQCWKKYHDLSLFTKIGYLLRKYGGHKIVKSVIRTLQGGFIK